MSKLISSNEVEKRLNKGEELQIIDVRDRDEVIVSGKIPGSKHIPLPSIAMHKEEFYSTKEYIVVCSCGNRGKAAAGVMEALGFQATNMIGGMGDWNGELE